MTNNLQFLLGRTLRLGETRYRLDKELGSGATAVVFLGVLADAPEDASGHVAIKIARPDDKSAESLRNEWYNLTRLAEAEHAYYFPSIRYPKKVEDLTQELFAGGDFIKVTILVQELVQGQGVAESAAQNKNLSLSEPLALEVARQYVEMLQTAHKHNITSFDRKIGDLRWNRKAPTDGNHSLSRWERDTAGSLKVLDWNVTHEASTGNIQLDFFRFGLLWHKLLLGTEPRFNPEGWRLIEPLSRQVGWTELTWGTRRILERLLAATEARYRQADELIADILAEITLWKQDTTVLEGSYRAIYEQNRNRMTPTFSDVENALHAADVHRHRRDLWRDIAPSDLDNIIRALSTAWIEGLLGGLRSSVLDSKWTAVRSNLPDIKTRPIDIVTQLYLDRIEQIVDFAVKKGLERHNSPLKEMFWQADAVQKYVIDTSAKDLTLEGIDEWRKLAEACKDATEKSVRTRLWMEAAYHYRFVTARGNEDTGRYLDASEHYGQIVSLRESLKSLRENTVNLLDQLYGDPGGDVARLRKLTAKTKADSDVVDLFRQGLQVIGVDAGNNDPISPKKLNAHLAVAVRQYPGCEPLIALYHLLAAEDVRRKYADSASLLAMQTLADERAAWETMLSEAKAGAQGGNDLPARLWTIVQELEKPVGDQLEDRQAQLRMAMLQTICVQPVLGENAEQTTDALSLEELLDQDSIHLKMLVDGYHIVFSEDKNFPEQLKRYLDKIKGDVQRWHGDLEQSAFFFDNDKAKRCLLWAKRGELVAPVLGQEWEQKLTVESLKPRFDEYERLVDERNKGRDYHKGCLLAGFFGGKKTASAVSEEQQ